MMRHVALRAKRWIEKRQGPDCLPEDQPGPAQWRAYCIAHVAKNNVQKPLDIPAINAQTAVHIGLSRGYIRIQSDPTQRAGGGDRGGHVWLTGAEMQTRCIREGQMKRANLYGLL